MINLRRELAPSTRTINYYSIRKIHAYHRGSKPERFNGLKFHKISAVLVIELKEIIFSSHVNGYKYNSSEKPFSTTNKPSNGVAFLFI